MIIVHGYDKGVKELSYKKQVGINSILSESWSISKEAWTMDYQIHPPNT